jgi:hypothetical protein
MAEAKRYVQKVKQEYEESKKRCLVLRVIIRDGDYKLTYPMLFDIDYEAQVVMQ